MIAQTARVDPELIEDMCTYTTYILAPIPASKNGAGFGEDERKELRRELLAAASEPEP